MIDQKVEKDKRYVTHNGFKVTILTTKNNFPPELPVLYLVHAPINGSTYEFRELCDIWGYNPKDSFLSLMPDDDLSSSRNEPTLNEMTLIKSLFKSPFVSLVDFFGIIIYIIFKLF